MFGSKPVDAFEKLLSKARAVLSERGKVLEGIRENESKLAAAENTLGAARTRVQKEEFDAAQSEGGLAIASRAASQAVEHAVLAARSIRLRLKGLRDKLAQVEEELSAARLALDQCEEEFLAGKLAEITAQFDEQIDSVIRMLSRVFVLRGHCGPGFVNKYNFAPSLFEFRMHNLARPSGPVINQALFRDRDGKLRSFDKDRLDDPEASQLNGELQAMKDRIAEIGAEAAGKGQQG